MNKQPDKIFRDKLEGYQRQAPTSAWEKIALSQTKKKHRGLWIKIAAAILLVSVAAFVLWPSKPANDLQLADQTKPKVSSPDIAAPLKAAPTTPKPNKAVTDESSSKSLAKHHKASPMDKKKSSSPIKIEQNHNGLPGEREQQDNNNSAAREVAVAPNVATKVEVNQPIEEHHSMTLVYTENDVSKYLNKKELDEATSDDKKSSTLKKLLKKANDLTNNQDPFGELRQKKNEILALNFRNEKRGQNK
ncbi:MAG TPA: hypothetical protein VK666_26495 [Chryseolinea sp.]|nr:hypothetical protein [Chryseolinea sp.]